MQGVKKDSSQNVRCVGNQSLTALNPPHIQEETRTSINYICICIKSISRDPLTGTPQEHPMQKKLHTSTGAEHLQNLKARTS